MVSFSRIMNGPPGPVTRSHSRAKERVFKSIYFETENWIKYGNKQKRQQLEKFEGMKIPTHAYMQTAYCMQKQYSNKHEYEKVGTIAMRDFHREGCCKLCQYGAYMDINKPRGPCYDNDYKSVYDFEGNRFTTYTRFVLTKEKDGKVLDWDWGCNEMVEVNKNFECAGAKPIEVLRLITDNKGETRWFPMCSTCSYGDKKSGDSLPIGWKFATDSNLTAYGSRKIRGTEYFETRTGTYFHPETLKPLTYSFEGEDFLIRKGSPKSHYSSCDGYYVSLANDFSSDKSIGTSFLKGYFTIEETLKKWSTWFSIDFPENDDRWEIAHTSHCIDTDDKQLKKHCYYRGFRPIPMKFQKKFSGHSMFKLSIEGWHKFKTYVYMSDEEREELTKSKQNFQEHFEGIPTDASVNKSSYEGLMDFQLMSVGTSVCNRVSDGKTPMFERHSSREELISHFHAFYQTPAHVATKDHMPEELVDCFPVISKHCQRFGVYNYDRIYALKETYDYMIETNFTGMFNYELTNELKEITLLHGVEFMEATRTFHEKLKDYNKKVKELGWNFDGLSN